VPPTLYETATLAVKIFGLSRSPLPQDSLENFSSIRVQSAFCPGRGRLSPLSLCPPGQKPSFGTKPFPVLTFDAWSTDQIGPPFFPPWRCLPSFEGAPFPTTKSGVAAFQGLKNDSSLLTPYLVRHLTIPDSIDFVAENVGAPSSVVRTFSRATKRPPFWRAATSPNVSEGALPF